MNPVQVKAIEGLEDSQPTKADQNIEVKAEVAPPTTVESDIGPVTPPPTLTLKNEVPQAIDRTDSTISIASPSTPAPPKEWGIENIPLPDLSTPLPESGPALTLRNAVPYFGRSDVSTDESPCHQTSPPAPLLPKRLSYTGTASLPYSTSSHVSWPTSKIDIPQEHKGPVDERPPWDWIHERRERELDRRSREFDRREREFERRERELERRQREFEHDKARWMNEVRSAPQWREAIETLRGKMETDLATERKKALDREAALEVNLMRKVNEILDRDRQMYGVMQMSDKEVNEMMESSVGYLMQSDEDIADRVRFQSLLYLSQERLAMEAGLEPASGSGSLSLAWRLALGPSVVTEIRYNKALELLHDREDYKLDEATKKIMESKKAMEYVVEFTSHLRKEGSEIGDHTFAPGRIPREAYMESVQRQANQAGVDFEALSLLVDYICPK